MHSAIITRPNKKVFAVLDIGTTKIVCIVIKVIRSNSTKIIGIVYKQSSGIYSGTIINAKEAANSVSSVIEEAEKNSEETIGEIYVNIAGSQISSRIFSTTITDISGKVTFRDIKRVLNRSNENVNNNEVIIHNIPLEYVLDNIKGITDPVGMYGNIMQMNMHTVTTTHSALLNLQHCVTQNQVYFKGCILSAYSSTIACINDNEKELGLTVIDIGGGSTSIGIFNEGNLVYANSIPVGGILITRDIASAFSISIADAEKIKVLRGNVIFTATNQNDIIELEKNGENSEKIEISLLDLVNVIRPRVEEIFEMIRDKIGNRITNKAILTGGASQLKNIKELAGHILGCQIRLGIPKNLDGLETYKSNPSLSASIGSLILIKRLMKENNIQGKKTGFFTKMLEFVKGS
ncbi:MAG: cell division protein FtsA [Rickettsiaceae bacterium H1]|nr:cell division protein FtsA [Rickettsiaceae bacterium H1]